MTVINNQTSQDSHSTLEMQDQFKDTPDLRRVWHSGNQLMAFSNLSYQGKFIDVREWKDIHVMEFGSGYPIMLIHGAGSGAAIWHRQIAALSKTNRVIAPEIPLFGLSKLPHEIPPIRSDVGKLIIDIMDVLNIQKAHIAGLSLGGLITIGALQTSAERFDKATLISSAGFGNDLPWIFRIANFPIINKLVGRPNYFLVKTFFNRMEAQMSEPSKERDQFIDYQFAVSERNGRPPILLDGISKFARFSGQRDVLDDHAISQISNPTLIIWGENDRFFPRKHPKRALKLMPNASLKIIPKCGHLIPAEAPQHLTNYLTEWFAQK